MRFYRVALVAMCALGLAGAFVHAQDSALKATLIAGQTALELDPVVASRNAAESPNPYPAPTSYSSPHMLVWNRVTELQAVPNTSPVKYQPVVKPFVVRAENVALVWPAEGSYDPTTMSQIVLDHPWGGGVVILGNWRDLAAEVAWAQKRRAVDMRREIK